MKPANRPAPQRCRDIRGGAVVKVALDPEGRRWATVDEVDFEALPADLSLSWGLNGSGGGCNTYVKAPAWGRPGNLVSVARVILQAGPGEWVQYRNSDRTDLRRGSLRLRKRRLIEAEEAAARTAPFLKRGRGAAAA